MRFFASACLGAAILVASFSAPAFAQSRAELASKNEALRLRVERLEGRMLTGDPAAERLMARVDTLETTIRTLRGEIERLSYERELSDARIDALEGDIRILQELSTRTKIHLDAVDLVASQNEPQVDDTYFAGPGTLSALPGAPTTTTQSFEVPEETDSLAIDQGALLEQGKRLLAEGNFAGAETSLAQYLGGNPLPSQVAEAQFWLGESRYVQGLYNGAAEAYIASMRADGTGARAPDALVMLAASLREVGQVSEACTALRSFDAQFPNAPSAARDKAARELSRTGC